MLSEEYRPAPYSKEYVESTLRRLSCLGPSKVVLTGVAFDKKRIARLPMTA